MDEKPRYQCKCGKWHTRSKTGPCPACAMKAYRANEQKGEERKKKHAEAVKEYNRKDPDRRNRWVRNYRERVGYYVPDDLRYAWEAFKRLEKALAGASEHAGVSAPAKHGCDYGAE